MSLVFPTSSSISNHFGYTISLSKHIPPAPVSSPRETQGRNPSAATNYASVFSPAAGEDRGGGGPDAEGATDLVVAAETVEALMCFEDWFIPSKYLLN